jgi:hypothetical protein
MEDLLDLTQQVEEEVEQVVLAQMELLEVQDQGRQDQVEQEE